MIANISKTNTGKLLVAVLAMFMIVAGAAIAFSDNTEAATGDVVLEGTTASVSDAEGLEKVIKGINGDSADYANVTVINIASGNYEIDFNIDLTNSDVDVTSLKQAGWTFPILKDGITIQGATAGVTTLICADESENAAWATQNFITVVGNNITLKNLTIIGKQSAESNKAVEILGSGFKMENVVIGSPDNIYGGSILFNEAGTSTNLNPVLEGVTVYNSYINAENASATTINIDGLTIDNTNITSYTGIEGTDAKYKEFPTIGNSNQFNVINESDFTIKFGDWTFSDDYSLPENSSTSVSGTLNIDKTLTVPATTELSMASGSMTNISGELVNNGKTLNNGTINLIGAGKTSGNALSGNQPETGFGISSGMIAIRDDLPLVGYAFLTGDLTIPEGKSITVEANGTLDLRGYTLTVEGTLNVEMGGNVTGLGSPAVAVDSEYDNIVLNGGTINNDGVIGYGAAPVTVQVETTTVDLQNVEGVSFGTVKVGGTNVLTVTGDVMAAISNSNVFKFDIDGAYITGTLSIDAEITTTIGINKVFVMKDAVFEIDGTVQGDAIKMLNGSTVVITGTCNADVTAETGTVETRNGTTGLVDSVVSFDNVTGITLSVASNAYVDDNGQGEPTSYTDYVLYISGTADLIVDTTGSEGSIEIVNDAGAITKVAADVTLAIPEDITFVAGETEVLGTIEYIDRGSVTEYIGTQYAVKNGTDTTYFIKEFTEALAVIDTADNKAVYVSGPVEVSAGFTLTDGQKIYIQSGDFTIAEDANVVVESGARVYGTITEVEGLLKVDRGANVQTVQKYAVSATGTDGSTTYAGFIAAIENSAAGDKITVTGTGYSDGELMVSGDVSIPAEREVIIQHDIVFKGDLTIEEGATVTNQDVIIMADEDATITVNGKLDSTATGASVNFNVKTTADVNDRNIFVTGEYIVNSANALTYQSETNKPDSVYAMVNGTFYINEDEEYVLTTFAKAVAAVASDDVPAVYIIGTVSEAGDITVTGNETVQFTVYVGYTDQPYIRADATLGTVTLDNAVISVTGSSKLSADVAGAYGTEGSTSEAVIDLDKVQGVRIVNGSQPNDLAEDVWSNTISYNTGVTTFTGKASVNSGEFVLGINNISFGTESKLTVAAGGEIVIPAGVTMTTSKNTVIDGTVTVKGTLNAKSEVAGTIDVQKDGSISINGLVLTGTLTVAEDAKSASVAGTFKVGATPKTLGTATGTVNGTIVISSGSVTAYNGVDLTGAVFNNNANVAAPQTTYIVNGITYATVYGNGTYNCLDAELYTLKDLDIERSGSEPNYTYDIDWFAGENQVTTGNVGDHTELTAEIAYKSVPIRISIGTGISMSVDNIIVDAYNGDVGGYPLTIGTHTVSAVVDPGYTGDIVITFNGQTINNGGTIEITSDMIGGTIVLSAGGNITQDSTVVVDGGSSGDSGMGLTDILLIVLVEADEVLKPNNNNERV